MAKKKTAKKKTSKRTNATSTRREPVKTPPQTPSKRNSSKRKAINGLIREFRTNTGLDLHADEVKVIASMTERQIDLFGKSMPLAWTKGYRTGAYNESKRR